MENPMALEEPDASASFEASPPAQGAPILSVVKRLPSTIKNARMVSILEDALADARAGKIVALGIAALTSDRHSFTVASGPDDPLLLLGAVYHLAHRINQDVEALAINDPADPSTPGGAA